VVEGVGAGVGTVDGAGVGVGAGCGVVECEANDVGIVVDGAVGIGAGVAFDIALTVAGGLVVCRTGCVTDGIVGCGCCGG